ncbi:hypothetical protein FOD75_11070 (plasmid) [Limosilactobacillus reuteri]|uniref:Uncharacterized protein n=1 Tax=Limosilactobacillus reuteri TaxID=1598 RepID=A0A517D8E7_LIMRT|nr:hypothetical protein [Limosilactobacillus reuteri]QDR73630.1 hypothetical protein FOD75_11070 [Limosilactobacillus reuteri]
MKTVKITLFDLGLNKVKEETLTKEALLSYQGEKTRLTLSDSSVHEGFIETSKFADDDIIGLWTFTFLNDETHDLESDYPLKNEQTWEFIPVSLITSVDLLLHSNPRWGGILTNKFQVVKPDLEEREKINKEFMKLMIERMKNGK